MCSNPDSGVQSERALVFLFLLDLKKNCCFVSCFVLFLFVLFECLFCFCCCFVLFVFGFFFGFCFLVCLFLLVFGCCCLFLNFLGDCLFVLL